MEGRMRECRFCEFALTLEEDDIHAFCKLIEEGKLFVQLIQVEEEEAKSPE